MYYWTSGGGGLRERKRKLVRYRVGEKEKEEERNRVTRSGWEVEMVTKEEEAWNGRKSLNTGTQGRKKLVVKSTPFRFHRPLGIRSLSTLFLSPSLTLGLSISPRFSSSSIT